MRHCRVDAAYEKRDRSLRDERDASNRANEKDKEDERLRPGFIGLPVGRHWCAINKRALVGGKRNGRTRSVQRTKALSAIPLVQMQYHRYLLLLLPEENAQNKKTYERE